MFLGVDEISPDLIFSHELIIATTLLFAGIFIDDLKL